MIYVAVVSVVAGAGPGLVDAWAQHPRLRLHLRPGPADRPPDALEGPPRRAGPVRPGTRRHRRGRPALQRRPRPAPRPPEPRPSRTSSPGSSASTATRPDADMGNTLNQAVHTP